MSKDELISEIIKLELEMTISVLNGHNPTIDDKFKETRKLLKKYRIILFNSSI